ncbi:penicillin-binding protein 2 [Candidatus Pelagibacter sp. RS39]|uniref:penicillin-binding protein 2 n=1 Tax=Candidatus Pelagibacter sp. RS39 TaxID=1977864 RepID=UPI000A163DDD|nr:penicillin-binding protein 2 [Candidatus Pelagibacter sp. RS39]ARJ48192.1 penicillin-binding protein 2 [Candidatus Pelagibacter sp. RS39]
MINISDSATKLNSLNRRMFILATAKIIILGGIVSRLFFLQVKENKKYLTLSDKNRIREWKLPPIRGDFEDYFGNTIAGNFEAYQLHIIPEEVEDFRYVIYRVKELLDLSEKQFKKILKKKNEIKPWETLIVADNLNWEKFSKINNHLYDLNGVKPVISISRDYPYKENFTHVLGYVSQANENDILTNENIKEKFVPGLKVGKTGLERSFEKRLIGSNSVERYEVNAYGRRISQLAFQKGDKGETIKLTIDTKIQELANELLKEKAGSICVMDIYTGAIIAMHSSPSFDPNSFVFGISQDEWQLIRNNPMKPLVNKSLSGNYSPGSTIKPIVALSALENEVIGKDFTVQCKGHKNPLELYGQTYHCWKKEGHGFVNLREAMKQSCDTYFYEVARRLGVDRLSVTAKKFGLGQKVFKDIFDNEKKGLVPNTEWKKNALGRNWVLGETIITGIGQGFIQTTPIQLCLMTAQIANGGYKIYPRIVANDESQYEDKFTPLYKNSRNIKIVQDAMFSSTNEPRGTSYRSRLNDSKYQFAGKTGTSQVKKITERDRELDLKTFQIPYEERDHALFIAFGPYKNPRYALSIIIEHGGSGGTVAAPLAKELFKMIVDRHEIRKNFDNKKYLDI